MLDEKDLQAIAALMDDRISASEARMTEKINEVRTELHKEISDTRAELNAKINDTRAELNAKINDTRTGVMAYIEAAVMPKFALLAEGHQTLLETLAPKDRVDALEDEVKFLKIVIRQMGDDLQALKKAN